VINPNQPVRVFKNWKHGCYSIMQNGRLKASAKQVRLADVEFRVRESGRSRMLRNKRPNLHAFAIGHLVEYLHPDDTRELESITGRGVYYDPYQFASFVDRDTQEPVMAARIAHFDEQGVVYT